MVFSACKQQRILFYFYQGCKSPTIAKLLRENDGVKASSRGVGKFLAKYRKTGSIGRHPGSGRPSIANRVVKEFVEQQMRLDDETTAHQLHQLLRDRGYSLSLRTVLRCRTSLGWTFRGSSYCQLIREPNKLKRLEWAQKHINDEFDDVIWSDECSVQLETHHCFCCRKKGEAPKSKLRYVNLLLLDGYFSMDISLSQ